MATIKQPGIGQGKGGGRPSRGEVSVIQLRLSLEASTLLEAHANAAELPLWRVVDDLVKTALGGQAPPEPPPKLAPLALEIAQEAHAFLALYQDRRTASKVLRKSWERALLLATHDMKDRAGVPEG